MKVTRDLRLKRGWKEVVVKLRENLKRWDSKILLEMVEAKRTEEEYGKRNNVKV